MKKFLLFLLLFCLLGCGGKEPSSAPEKNVIKQAVEQAVTQEIKSYEGAKQSLEKIEKEAAERQREAADVK